MAASPIGHASVAFIVLGCTVNADLTPSDWLRARLEACRDEIAATSGGKPFCVIVTGGAVRSVISEAQCMSSWFQQHAAEIVPAERVVLEEQAQDTLENFVYSVALLKQLSCPTLLEEIVIVTNDFHIERSLELFNLEAAFQQLHPARVRTVAAASPGLEGERLTQRLERETMLLEQNVAAHNARKMASCAA